MKDVVAVAKRAEIKAVFMNDEDLPELWSSEGADRCCDKVKSIIRKRLRNGIVQGFKHGIVDEQK